MSSYPDIHFQFTPEDKPFIHSFKKLLVGRCRASVNFSYAETSMDAVAKHKKWELSGKYIVSTDQQLLRHITKKSNASLDDFAGSIISHLGYEHLFIHPLKHLMTVSYGKFLTRRFLKKFLQPEDWIKLPKFTWEVFEPSRERDLLTLLEEATFVACDIENDYPSELRCITCVGFTAVRINSKDGTITVHTFVVPFTDEYNIAFIRNAVSTEVFKIFQNGKFDIAYLLRFAIPITNYAADTINLFHSWYSELPKDLALLASFCLRDWTYWKDEAAAQPLTYEHYLYNAKDNFATAMVFLVLMQEMPEFAIKNFEMEFPVVYPCILAEQYGMKIDGKQKQNLDAEIKTKADALLASLRVQVNDKNYNPGSPKQTKKLWIALGSQDIESTDKVGQDKVASRHPLNERIVSDIKKVREYNKARSAYTAKDFVWMNRCYYAINPHGTDSGRLSSREAAYNCGFNIQNIKRDGEEFSVKSMFIADEGFHYGEADYAQNESWGTAYTTGDHTLISIVEDRSKYFHALNASKFFGLDYDDLAKSTQREDGSWHHKKLNKEIIDIAKRVNHGANYNMTAPVLLNTMGIKNVIKAKQLLNLPRIWSLLQVCQHLLDNFDITFPIVRGKAYYAIKNEIASTGQMVGPTGWTRICFSDPNTDGKRAMNMYAAHKPQSLAAMVLNKAYVRVLNEVWRENKNDFKLNPQIHDSIVFQYRIGRIDLAHAVAKCMDIHTPVTDIFGITHDLNVPVDLKGGSNRWSELESL